MLLAARHPGRVHRLVRQLGRECGTLRLQLDPHRPLRPAVDRRDDDGIHDERGGSEERALALAKVTQREPARGHQRGAGDQEPQKLPAVLDVHAVGRHRRPQVAGRPVQQPVDEARQGLSPARPGTCPERRHRSKLAVSPVDEARCSSRSVLTKPTQENDTDGHHPAEHLDPAPLPRPPARRQPGGPGRNVPRLETGREVLIRAIGEFERKVDVANTIVAIRDGRPILVRDVGRVEDGLRTPTPSRSPLSRRSSH